MFFRYMSFDMRIKNKNLFELKCSLFLPTKGSLVDYRAYKPYTFVGLSSKAWY